MFAKRGIAERSIQISRNRDELFTNQTIQAYLVILRDIEWHNRLFDAIIAQNFRAPVPIFTWCLEKEKYM